MENWISVEDRLPGEYRGVLICEEDAKEAEYGFISSDTGFNIYDPNYEYGIRDGKNVTHWQYPPDPPREAFPQD